MMWSVQILHASHPLCSNTWVLAPLTDECRVNVWATIKLDLILMIKIWICPLINLSLKINLQYMFTITKLSESGDLCGKINEFEVRVGIHHHPKRSDIAIQISRRRFCFYVLLFNNFMSFPVKVYEINMYLILYILL